MADKFVHELPETTTISDTDVFVVEDNAVTSKITKANLKTQLGLNDKEDKTSIGNRTYTEQNVVTNGESVTDSIDELDMEVAEKANKVQEAWNTITFVNGWTGSYQPRYKKDELGVVHVSGTCSGGTNTVGTTIFSLPSGYRPLDRIYTIARGFKPSVQVFTPLLVLGDGGVSIATSEAPEEIHFNFSFIAG